ncbi:MAG TPA: hypothetical protein ENF21_10850 [Bacteroidetes bacterium]|nr:hypothetical protein [Bacteroidota bacterium]
MKQTTILPMEKFSTLDYMLHCMENHEEEEEWPGWEQEEEDWTRWISLLGRIRFRVRDEVLDRLFLTISNMQQT